MEFSPVEATRPLRKRGSIVSALSDQASSRGVKRNLSLEVASSDGNVSATAGLNDTVDLTGSSSGSGTSPL